MPTSSSNLRTALAAHPERFRVATALLAERLVVTPQPAERPRFPRIPRMSGGSQPEAVLGRLHALGLSGMAEAFSRAAGDDHDGLRHVDWLMHLLDSEVSERAQRRLRARLRSARLRYPASVENVDYCASRGLDRAQFQTLASGHWIAQT